MLEINKVYNMDCVDGIKLLDDNSIDLVIIDPPYKLDIGVDAIKKIIDLKLLAKEGIIILETDEEERDIKELEKLEIEIYDKR